MLLLLLCTWISISLSYGQIHTALFTSSDKEIEGAFEWAKGMAMSYKGEENDHVGPWYEAALPSRFAFCMRDASHQCIGAEILGWSEQNLNIFSLFAKNISVSKDWCSYWEINKWNKPAPEDYRNDKEFWYNLPANFDLLYATWRLYQWTGNKSYIEEPNFIYFQEKTVDDYIDKWVLSADSLFFRPSHVNVPIPYNEKDYFHSCRGLPSYTEGIPGMKMGADLVAALYRGLITYSDILKTKGQTGKADIYARKAEQYRNSLETEWWSNENSQYYSYYCDDGKFRNDEPGTYLLWFDALNDIKRKNLTVEQIITSKSNVENMSYWPYLLYTNGNWIEARNFILRLSDSTTARREYPEVSFGVLEGVVKGAMGIDPDAEEYSISTLSRIIGGNSATILDLPILQTFVDLSHRSDHQSEMTNKGKKSFIWKAKFSGIYASITVDKSSAPVNKEFDSQGKPITFVMVPMDPGKHASVEAFK